MLRGRLAGFGATDSLVVMPRLVNHARRFVVAIVRADARRPPSPVRIRTIDSAASGLRAESQRLTRPS